MTDSHQPLAVIHDPAEFHRRVASLRQQGRSVGLVPTMGALHEGHLSLVETAVAECDFCAATIFVNPAQFGPSEDFDRYPRTLEKDLESLARAGANLVFVPEKEAVYRPGHATWVEVGGVAEPLEGQCRPGHFRGVATIVLKLFNIAGADVAYFGQKDYQQALVIQHMVDDLNVPIRIRVCPTVREADGLAMSSRNAYLSPEERTRAAALYRSLRAAEEMAAGGEKDPEQIRQRIESILNSEGNVDIQYIALCDPQNLQPLGSIEGETLVALAVRIGQTRLIDNHIIRS